VPVNYVEHTRACFAKATTRELVGHQKEVRKQIFRCYIRFDCSTHSPPQVHSVAWNCTGRKLASGSVDQTARVWTMASPVRTPFVPLSSAFASSLTVGVFV
jgi:WD40 repeat protein